MKKLVLWDIDGVLLDSSWRYRTQINPEGREVIDLDYWKREAARGGAWFDTPLPHADIYREMLSKPDEFYVVLCTSRLMDSRDHLAIEQRIGKPHAIISRKNDLQSGSGLKVQGAKRLLRLRQFKDCSLQFFDDNLGNIRAMMRAFGSRVACHYVPSNQGH